MNQPMRILVFSILLLCLFLLSSAFAGVTERLSVDSNGSQVDGASWSTGLSADGRYVVFTSLATDLVPGDTNDAADVFVHDRVTGATMLVSVDSNGVQGNGPSGSDWIGFQTIASPAVSADGRFVAFTSMATNLVAGDTNDEVDVFVHDCITGLTERVSVDSHGAQGNARSGYQSVTISADGRIVAFDSWATDLVPGDTNGASDIFVHDRETGQTTRVSVDSNGYEANAGSWASALSADGAWIAFDSFASNLVPGDMNANSDVFVHGIEMGQTVRVSVAAGGTEANGGSLLPSICANGTRVVFQSNATNLVTEHVTDEHVYLHDLGTGDTVLVSLDERGRPMPNPSNLLLQKQLSGDGRFVIFTSYGTAFPPPPSRVFVHELACRQSTLVAVNSNGDPAQESDFGSLSYDGQLCAFASWGDNLVPGDTNGAVDIFGHRPSTLHMDGVPKYPSR
ncbi:MAG: hypothetical protein U1E76_24525 [Planctomycetota bacterium]